MIAGVIHGSVVVGAFFIVWFLAFFCLLPVGLGPVDPDTGAPLHLNLLKKAAIAFAIAVVTWGGFITLIALRVLDI